MKCKVKMVHSRTAHFHYVVHLFPKYLLVKFWGSAPLFYKSLKGLLWAIYFDSIISRYGNLICILIPLFAGVFGYYELVLKVSWPFWKVNVLLHFYTGSLDKTCLVFSSHWNHVIEYGFVFVFSQSLVMFNLFCSREIFF